MSDTEFEIKLDTAAKTQAQKMHKGKEIGIAMNADPNPQVATAGAQLLGPSNAMETINTNRNNKQSEAAGLTDDLNDMEDTWDKRYKKAAQVATDEYPGDDGKWKDYGFEVITTGTTKRPKPDKVNDLRITAGDGMGELDLMWDPLPRKAIDGYHIEINTTDPIDHSQWKNANPRPVTASKATISDLISGQKYWVHIIAFVGAVLGTPSDSISFTAP
jgi:hypothetical protein